MRCAIDSNLLISSTFKLHSPPALVVAAWRMRRIDWVSCSDQIDEVSMALLRPKVLARSVGGAPLARQLLQEMQRDCRIHTLTRPLPAICRDPRDDFLFALYDQGHTDWIISGDNDVLALKSNYPILTARELIDRL
ncbi:MAG: putative toxin-antitoxin system toxin component, PIN family [Ferruginibacter sp.]|nr:putative toxin-antitoxin system toxin component, PIN family [Rhodoferax sp.]